MYHFWPHFSTAKNHLKNFILVTHPTCLPNFIQLHPQLFEIPCSQRETDRHENDLRAPSVVEVTTDAGIGKITWTHQFVGLHLWWEVIRAQEGI